MYVKFVVTHINMREFVITLEKIYKRRIMFILRYSFEIDFRIRIILSRRKRGSTTNLQPVPHVLLNIFT